MSTKRKTLITTALVAAIALSVPATMALAKGGFGDGMRGMGPAMLDFADLDLNGDGQVTRDELSNLREAHFKRVDTDGNGELSAAEIEAEASARRGAFVAQMIERHDADGNGSLSAEELENARGMRGKGHREARGEGQMGKRHGDRREARMEHRMDHLFDRADTNNDGAISAEEFETAKAEMLQRRGGHRDN